MATTPEENRPSLAFAAAMILVAALFIVFAKDIPRRGLAGDADPGPRALPVAMALVIAVGGLIELTRVGLHRRRQQVTDGANSSAAVTTAVDDSTPSSYASFWLLTGAVLVYLIGLSWLGFQISTTIFVTMVLTWLGARWWSALLSGLALVIVVRILFGGLFHVQLPEGAFGLSF